MTGLDPVGRVEVKRIIQRLGEQGKTVLFNSHILADVAELCSRIAIMRAGQVIWTGTVDEAKPVHGSTLEDFFMEVVTA
jgi:ABC-2 type transport system ATP-binding protein